VLVDERNQRVKDTAETWFARPTKTFCVSAKDYRTNCLGYRLGEVDRLPIHAERSEIPALKRHIAALSAPRRQRDLARYITNTIPNLLNSLEIAFSQVKNTHQFVGPYDIDSRLKVRV
jgi:hypothetical protein